MSLTCVDFWQSTLQNSLIRKGNILSQFDISSTLIRRISALSTSWCVRCCRTFRVRLIPWRCWVVARRWWWVVISIVKLWISKMLWSLHVKILTPQIIVNESRLMWWYHTYLSFSKISVKQFKTNIWCSKKSHGNVKPDQCLEYTSYLKSGQCLPSRSTATVGIPGTGTSRCGTTAARPLM